MRQYLSRHNIGFVAPQSSGGFHHAARAIHPAPDHSPDGQNRHRAPVMADHHPMRAVRRRQALLAHASDRGRLADHLAAQPSQSRMPAPSAPTPRYRRHPLIRRQVRPDHVARHAPSKAVTRHVAYPAAAAIAPAHHHSIADGCGTNQQDQAAPQSPQHQPMVPPDVRQASGRQPRSRCDQQHAAGCRGVPRSGCVSVPVNAASPRQFPATHYR